MHNIQQISFGDLYAIPSKNGLMAPSRLRGTGVPLINMREIFSFSRINTQEMELAPLPIKDSESWLVETGDLLFARQSLVASGAGKCVLVQEANFPRTFESHIIRVRLRRDLCNPTFFFYYFNSVYGRSSMASIVEQVAAAGIRASDLSRLEVPVPPLALQNVIAETLGAIDDKIESLQKSVRLAQDLAQSTFKAWFVSGEHWGGLQPSDWKAVKLKDICELRRDSVKAGKFTDLPYVPVDSLQTKNLAVHNWKPNSEAQSSLVRFEEDDILIGAMRVYFHRVAIAPFAGLTRTTAFTLRPKRKSYLAFSLLFCNEETTIEFAQTTSKGSTMPYAVWEGGLASMDLLLPTEEVLEDFARTVGPIIDFVKESGKQLQALSDLRDFLLPELLSGRIRVGEDLA